MANERSDNDPLFMKLVTPEEIRVTLSRSDYGPYWMPMSAWGLAETTVHQAVNYGASLEEFEAKAWVAREAYRMAYLWERLGRTGFDTGDLADLCEPGRATQFWRWCLAPSYSDPTKVRYTPTEEYGKADRQVVTTLGKFLTKHYPQIGEGEIKRWASTYAGLSQPTELLFAETPDEVEDVYVNGPESCMSGGDDAFDSNEHPARIWGYCKDTAVAYVKAGGKITGRALVRKSKKLYIRMYPSDNPRLEAALRLAGYKHDSLGLEGVKVPYMEQRKGVLMPYVDGIGSASWDGGSTLTITGDGGISCTNTNGLCYPENDQGESCSNCGSRHDADEMGHSDYHEHDVCPSCSDHFTRAFVARGERDWISNDEVVHVPGVGDVHHDDDVFQRLGLVELEDGRVVREEHAVTLEDGTAVHIEDACFTVDEVWHLRADCVRAWTVEGDGWIHESDAVDVDGQLVCRRDEDEYRKQLLEQAGQQRLELAA
jgi:hypothetical protein